MTKLEEKARRNLRKTRIQEALLRTLLVNDRLAAASLLPATLNYLLDLDLPVYERKKEAVSSAAARLRKRGLVSFSDGHYSLTAPGRKILEKWSLSDYRIEAPKRWDGRWRVVIFDIPERKRRIRTELRHILNEAGFHRLQDSVWVIPYECEELIGLLKTDLGIGPYLLYVIADQIENDKYLKIEFGLTP